MALLPPEFFLEASQMALQELELSARSRSSSLSKVLRHELDAWIEQEATAMVARWFIEYREVLVTRVVTSEIGPVKANLFTRERKKMA